MAPPPDEPRRAGAAQAAENAKRILARLFFHPTDPATTLIWAAVSGLAAGAVALLYHAAFDFLTGLAVWCASGGQVKGWNAPLAEAAGALPWFSKLLLPAAGATLAALLLARFFRQAARGPADILEAVAITDGRIPTRPSLLKAAASLVTITTGGSIGREGPVIQLGATTTSKIGQFLGFAPARLRILAGCGAAAGVAVAFHTTIGAALFVMEVIFGNFSPELFGPLVLASVTATVVARFAYGSTPLFGVERFDFHAGEIPLYIFLGVFAGVVAPLFMKSLWRIERSFKRAVSSRTGRMALAGGLVGAAGIFCPEIWGNGADTIRQITWHTLSWKLLLLVLILKPLATALMVGSGAPGGVFTPTLLIGACAGGLLGEVFLRYWPRGWGEPNPVSYALIGMGAMLAGTTQAPLSAIFILFEMVLDYDAVLPLMLACSIAGLVSRSLHRESIYTEPLRRQGIRLSHLPEAHLLSATRVADLLRPAAAAGETVECTAPFSKIVASFMNGTHTHLYVVDGKGIFRGAIRLHDLKEVLHAEQEMKFLIAQDLLDPSFPTALPEESLAQVLDRFIASDCERLPVLAGASDRRFLGTVSKRDILDLYNREIVGRRSLTATALVPADRRGDALLSTYRIESCPVPEAWTGRTLETLDLPRRFAVTVLAIETQRGVARIQRPPAPGEPLRAEDAVLLLGTSEQIRKALAADTPPPAG